MISWFRLMKRLRDVRNVPTSNEGSFLVRHGGHCFDLYKMSSSVEPVLLSGVGISCYLSSLRGRRAHRYLCISVGPWISRVAFLEILGLTNDKPCSSSRTRRIISWHLSFQHIRIKSSNLLRPPRAWRVYNLLFCFFVWTILTQETDSSYQISLKSRSNPIHTSNMRAKKFWTWRGDIPACPLLATRLVDK